MNPFSSPVAMLKSAEGIEGELDQLVNQAAVLVQGVRRHRRSVAARPLAAQPWVIAILIAVAVVVVHYHGRSLRRFHWLAHSATPAT